MKKYRGLYYEVFQDTMTEGAPWVNRVRNLDNVTLLESVGDPGTVGPWLSPAHKTKRQAFEDAKNFINILLTGDES